MTNSRFQSARDFRKSLEARLQQEAKKGKGDLQRLRRRVAFDRLLARLFSEEECGSFFLKGGYAMELRTSAARATKDIDITYFKSGRNATSFSDEQQLLNLRRLASLDLDDFFTYPIGESQLDLDSAPYGGARYPISSFIDGRLFVRFHLDVGGDVLVSELETVKVTPDWLHFCSIPAPTVQMIAVEQQFAEKIHAYTLPRSDRGNSRVKDLIDLLLILQMRAFDSRKALSALQRVFKARNTHPLPLQLSNPPVDWATPYRALAEECGLAPDIDNAFSSVKSAYLEIVNSKQQTDRSEV